MNIGNTVTWREAIRRQDKQGGRQVAGIRNITGIIVEEGKSRRGAATLKVQVTAVAGDGADITGLVIARKRRIVAQGRSWYRAEQRRRVHMPPTPG
ncbi:MAG: hypothetical protein EOO81_07295 [Oxalobacteraceae bacterium]|nr:MAG: hypothetical protein EOO81_07295 [Oxalobacteraceae bacterium]